MMLFVALNVLFQKLELYKTLVNMNFMKSQV